MKTTDPRDPLDKKIDDLFASRPITPSDDFAARVLAAADELPAKQTRTSPIGQLLRFALPIAAAIAIALTFTQFKPKAPTTEVASIPTPTETHEATNNLSTADMQEIFILEEALASLSTLQDDTLDNADLLSTFDALYFEI
ncbi:MULTISPECIES: hypothetical protein [unclassified Lentimonas]|uniref:hypothetical protein n=1 Tax=unclassified Lentimonas TaxID=2630993 RepID=UPI001326BEE1|nr:MULTISPECIES: hypothetical protein [unclassified Lentimonas]CAA6677895.1 Unannotated [Lentimonas sp. CC4]CAA6683999.1 Unannotated [Lentimonas sp. CC6]CAA6689893.1 Unannotated [Lentimonas sp. CC10]CAA6697139.1 Unannotated [Lentimonas sp. CC19]CAA7069413.1 Unannotated [Lentimonas sp. CC11]